MPRFFFHLDDGSTRQLDAEGMVLPDAEAAWYQAIRNARDIIGQESSGPFRTGQRVEIEDEEGQPVWAVPLDEVVRLALC